MVGMSPAGLVRLWNPGAEQLFGYTEAEALGRHIRFLNPPSRPGECDRNLNRLLAGEELGIIETERMHRDGRLVEVSTSAAPILTPDGSVSGIAAIYRNIAGRRAAEREMLHLNERLQLAIAAAGLGTWDLDLQTGVLVWSERCRAMFGIGPDAPVSMDDFYAGLHPDDRERITAIFAAATDPATARRITTSSTARSARRTVSNAGSPPAAAPVSMRQGAASARSAPRARSPCASATSSGCANSPRRWSAASPSAPQNW